MSNVVSFPSTVDPVASRVVQSLSLEEFCVADARHGWSTRHRVNGMTMLQYPAAILIRDADGRCSAIRYRGIEIEGQLAEAIAAIA